MIIGTVVDVVIAPTKHPGLRGGKLLLVEVDQSRDRTLSLDAVGAGIGDRVMIAVGSHAVSLVRPLAPADSVIVGILDPGHQP